MAFVDRTLWGCIAWSSMVELLRFKKKSIPFARIKGTKYYKETQPASWNCWQRCVVRGPPLRHSPGRKTQQPLTPLTRPTRSDTWTLSSATYHADAWGGPPVPTPSHWSNSSACRPVPILESKVQVFPSHVTCFFCSLHTWTSLSLSLSLFLACR